MYSLLISTVFILMFSQVGGNLLNKQNIFSANGVLADRYDEAILVENFIIYRAAVIKFLQNAPATKTGAISDSNLTLPPGYTKLANWITWFSSDYNFAYIYSDSAAPVSASVITAQPGNPWFSSGQIGFRECNHNAYRTFNSDTSFNVRAVIPVNSLMTVIERQLPLSAISNGINNNC